MTDVDDALLRYRLTSEALALMAELTTQPNVLRPYVVTACFDESGKWTDSAEVFVFAGLVTSEAILRPLALRWAARLGQDKIPYTSMKDAIHFEGPYKTLKDTPETRDSLIRDLAQLFVETNGILRIASPLETATFEAFNKLSREQQKAFLGNPYYGAFEACVLGALATRSDTRLQIICDLAEEYSEKCVTAFNKLRKAKPEAKERCLGIAFADDEWHPPLQMADMLAYCQRAQVLKRRGEAINPLVEDVISILHTDDVEERHVQYRIQGELGGLGEGELGVE